MKFKLDENIPVRLKTVLSAFGHDVDTVFDEGAKGSVDEHVWGLAQAAERILITQDLDFSDINRFTPGTHAGLFVIRMHNPGREKLLARIEQVFQHENVQNWAKCFVVISDVKIRIHRPKP